MKSSLLGPGQSFGPYQILSIIGSGGMGQILKVQRGPKIYALKILHDQSIEAIERFKREAETLLKTEQLPYFSRIYSFALEPLPHLLIEYFDAQDLETWRDANELDEDQALKFSRKLAIGLRAFHDLGFVHRDLKPKNILIQTDSSGAIEPIIIDFGLVTAQSFESLTLSREILGTPLTMAPEQWQNSPKAKLPSVDIWALGITHYFLIAGRYPFNGTPIQIFKQASQVDLNKLLIDVPERSQELLKHCLKHEPEQRPENLAALFDQIHTSQQDKSKTKKLSVRGLLLICTLLCIALIGSGTYFAVRWYARRSQVSRVKGQFSQSFKLLKSKHIKEVTFEYFCQKIQREGNIEYSTKNAELQKHIEHFEQAKPHLTIQQINRVAPLLFTISHCRQLSPPALAMNSEIQQLKSILDLKLENANLPNFLNDKRLNQIYRLCFESKKNDFLTVFTTLDSPTQKLKPGLRTSLLDSVVIQYFESVILNPSAPKRLDSKVLEYCADNPSFRDQLQGLVNRLQNKRLTEARFARLIDILIENEFGMSYPWPELDPKRVATLTRKIDKRISDLQFDNSSPAEKTNPECLKLWATLIYLQSEQLQATGSVSQTCPAISPYGLKLGLFLQKHDSHRPIAQAALINGLQSSLLHPAYFRNHVINEIVCLINPNQSWLDCSYSKFEPRKIGTFQKSQRATDVNRLIYWATPIDPKSTRNNLEVARVQSSPRAHQVCVEELLKIRKDKLPPRLQLYRSGALAFNLHYCNRDYVQRVLKSLHRQIQSNETMANPQTLNQQLARTLFAEKPNQRDALSYALGLQQCFEKLNFEKINLSVAILDNTEHFIKISRDSVAQESCDRITQLQLSGFDFNRELLMVVSRRLNLRASSNNQSQWKLAIKDVRKILQIRPKFSPPHCTDLAKLKFKLGKDFPAESFLRAVKNKDSALKSYQRTLAQLRKS